MFVLFFILILELFKEIHAKEEKIENIQNKVNDLNIKNENILKQIDEIEQENIAINYTDKLIYNQKLQDIENNKIKESS